jgi:hypothetical protein
MTDTQDIPIIQDDAATPDAPATPPSPTTQNTPAAPSAPELADKSSPLEGLIASIRAAVAPGVSTEARAAGAAACRAILTALEVQVGQPLTAATPAATLGSLLSHLASLPREQILEFLRDKFPAGLSSRRPSQPTAGPRFHLIQIPQVRPRGNGS